MIGCSEKQTPLLALTESDCPVDRLADDLVIVNGWIQRGGIQYARIASHNLETGHFEATVVSSNRFLDGQSITGFISADKAKPIKP